jgi:hypothetical protein
MYSSQFNLTRIFLNSFVVCFLAPVILFHLYGRTILCLRCLRVVLLSREKKRVLVIFFKKWGEKISKQKLA